MRASVDRPDRYGTDPAHPQPLASVAAESMSPYFAVRGSTLFLSEGYRLRAIEAAPPLVIRELSRLPVWNAGEVHVDGDLAVVSSSRQQLVVIDVSDPTEMSKQAKSTKKPPMPDKYDKLPAADMDALVAYMQSLK